MATFFISGGFVIATLFVIIKKDALNQPTLFKVAHSGDANESYTIDFKTSGVYVSESNYFAQKFSDGIYHVEADTIILIDSLPGIERLLKISETKTGKHLLQINSKEGIPTGDSLQIIVDNRNK
ncbi:hypothetical protein ACLI1A_00065 [Flavobacterium sp. RHBU_3]|uniref:hypothetical protein n=1 Tax=Flavobacterium sp. RHBU_3 TaxID=3391184 RepID=UPI003985566A